MFSHRRLELRELCLLYQDHKKDGESHRLELLLGDKATVLFRLGRAVLFPHHAGKI